MTVRKSLLFVSVLLVGAVLLSWPRLANLFNVVTMFGEDKIVANFSNMREVLYHVDIAGSSNPQPWPLAERELELPRSFAWHGKAQSLPAFLDRTATTSLLVVQDGKIMFEDYRLGTEQADLRISWSMAKSFLSALFGIAVHEGAIRSLEQPVTDYVPTLKDSAYDGVPIRHVLNMASGVEFDEDYLAFNSDINKMGRVLALGGSMDEFAKNLERRARAPGTQRQYVSIDTHVLAMVLRAATGLPLRDYFEEKLWSRLGSEGPAYYLTDGGGVAFALGGLNMMTRDYARFGELFRLRGNWRGEQVVPGEWVDESTMNSAPPTISTYRRELGYGYQWWVPPRADGEFFAVGIYGQYIYVNRKTGTVIVKTSADRNFRSDGRGGAKVIQQTIELFRVIARSASPSAPGL